MENKDKDETVLNQPNVVVGPASEERANVSLTAALSSD